MDRKAVTGITLTLLLIGALGLVFDVGLVGAGGTIYIRADGSRDPPTAPTQSDLVNALSVPPPPVEWNKTYGGSDDESATSVVQTSDGGYAIAGWVKYPGTAAYTDFWLVKTDAFGNQQWNRTYGGPTRWEDATSVVQTSDGGYAIAGTQLRMYYQEDFLLVKTDSAGNLQWSRTYGLDYYDDVAHSVVQTSDGGFALAGYTWSFGAGNCDFWLVKTDSAGAIQWWRTYGGTSYEFATSVVQTSDGGYAIAGTTRSFGAGEGDFWLVKTDSSGNVQWNRTYGGTVGDYCQSMVQTSDGGYAMAGHTYSFGGGGDDFWLVKTDDLGNLQWSRTYGNTHDEWAYSVVQTSDGGYTMAGCAYYFNRHNFWLVKTDSSGNMEWNQTYAGIGYNNIADSVVETSDGGYAIAGCTDAAAGDIDFWLVKVGPPPPPAHDIAILSVTTSKTVVGQGYSLKINVTATNQGDFTENFNVTAYANTTSIVSQTITLSPGSSTTITFTWNTTGVPYGNYTISAYAWPVQGETDTDDNTKIDGTVTVTAPPPPGVGGVVVPVDKLSLLAPYIALASTILVATAATAIYVNHVKRRKKKQ